jgi:hypothetical protein
MVSFDPRALGISEKGVQQGIDMRIEIRSSPDVTGE